VPGRAPTALFFFSVGCGECVGGAKSLARAQAAAQKSGGKGTFLAVDIDPSESANTITDFLRGVEGTELSAVIDKNPTLASRYQVAALSTLIVDPAGTVTYRATDPPADQITTAVEQAGAK